LEKGDKKNERRFIYWKQALLVSVRPYGIWICVPSLPVTPSAASLPFVSSDTHLRKMRRVTNMKAGNHRGSWLGAGTQIQLTQIAGQA